MHKSLYHFLELHNVLFVNQFGFRKNNSTSYALMEITENIKESIDKGKFGCGVYIDLRKAFDTVNHSILLKRIRTLWSQRNTSRLVHILFNWNEAVCFL